MDFLHTIEHHILDHHIWSGFQIAGIAFPLTKHSLLMWAVSLLLVVFFFLVSRGWPVVPTGIRNLIETFVVFIRDEVVLPNTGDEGRPYLPYFLTLFFFILCLNLIGLIPGSATPTGNVSVTGGLALCSFGLINVAGIRQYGFVKHFKNFIPHGLPAWLIPLMFPLEIVGLLTRTFALAIRLFANMVAGHIVMLAFLALSFLIGSIFVSLGSIPVAIGIGLLETFVAFLQAYIFTFLTAIFVGATLHPH